jgi:hypothetical protein
VRASGEQIARAAALPDTILAAGLRTVLYHLLPGLHDVPKAGLGISLTLSIAEAIEGLD